MDAGLVVVRSNASWAIKILMCKVAVLDGHMSNVTDCPDDERLGAGKESFRNQNGGHRNCRTKVGWHCTIRRETGLPLTCNSGGERWQARDEGQSLEGSRNRKDLDSAKETQGREREVEEALQTL
jgi:hypothetical protein